MLFKLYPVQPLPEAGGLNPPDSENPATLTSMTDVHSTEIRSYNMSRIKGKNTKPELFALKPSHECDSLSRFLSGAKDKAFIYSNAYSEWYSLPLASAFD